MKVTNKNDKGYCSVQKAVDSVESEAMPCPNKKIWYEAFENKKRIKEMMGIKIK